MGVSCTTNYIQIGEEGQVGGWVVVMIMAMTMAMVIVVMVVVMGLVMMKMVGYGVVRWVQ